MSSIPYNSEFDKKNTGLNGVVLIRSRMVDIVRGFFSDGEALFGSANQELGESMGVLLFETTSIQH